MGTSQAQANDSRSSRIPFTVLNISFDRSTLCPHRCWQRLLANLLEQVSNGTDVNHIAFFAAVFGMSRNAPSRQRDTQKSGEGDYISLGVLVTITIYLFFFICNLFIAGRS